jgi:hypothetical protein
MVRRGQIDHTPARSYLTRLYQRTVSQSPFHQTANEEPRTESTAWKDSERKDKDRRGQASLTSTTTTTTTTTF